MNPRNDRPHPLALERWLLSEADQGGLSEPEQQALRAEDERLRAQLFASLPPARFAARVRSAARPPRRGLALALVAAAAAFALLCVPRPPAHEERAKGQALELRVYRRQGESVERVLDGAEVAAHEVVQLGYLREGHAYGVLLSIDGRGEVTLHHPARVDGSSALSTDSGETILGQAYELDDAPDFERFIFVSADQPLDVAGVVTAARALAADAARARSAPLTLPTPNQQRTVLLRKPG